VGLDNYKSYEVRDRERDSLRDMKSQIQDQDPERSKREDSAECQFCGRNFSTPRKEGKDGSRNFCDYC
jgi:formylmethanofuran dehydrogenase subunit E